MPRDQEIDWENWKYHVIYIFSHGGMDPLEFPVQNRLKTLNLEMGAAQMMIASLVKAWKSCISPGLHTNVVGIS